MNQSFFFVDIREVDVSSTSHFFPTRLFIKHSYSLVVNERSLEERGKLSEEEFPNSQKSVPSSLRRESHHVDDRRAAEFHELFHSNSGMLKVVETISR